MQNYNVLEIKDYFYNRWFNVAIMNKIDKNILYNHFLYFFIYLQLILVIAAFKLIMPYYIV